MSVITQYEAVLKDIETAVIEIWRQHRDMTNYAAQRAYEAAIAHYHDVAREVAPKPVKLAGLERELYEAIHEACERHVATADKPAQVEPGVPLEELVACLRRLRKSVEFWTKKGGRQGYMEFIEGYLP